MRYLICTMLFLTSLLANFLYAVEFDELHPGQFDYHGKTGFIQFYHDPTDQSYTLTVDDAYLESFWSENEPFSVAVQDVNNDGWEDFCVLHKSSKPGIPLGGYNLFPDALILYVAKHIDLHPEALTYFPLTPAFLINIPQDATISSHDKIFLQDLNFNGKMELFSLGWDNNNQNFNVYWKVGEIQKINVETLPYSSSFSEPRSGSIYVPSSIVDASLFHSESNYYLLFISKTLAYIYRYNSSDSSFDKVRVIPTDKEIHQISSLNSDHPLLLQYNLFLHVGDHLSLKHYSEKGEISEALLIESNEINVSQGYHLDEVYFNETSSDGKFAIWWQQTDGRGKLIFYSISQEEDTLKLIEEDGSNYYSFVEYLEKPFKVAYRSSNPIDDGAWALISADRRTTVHYNY